jgi:hypothetical protein
MVSATAFRASNASMSRNCNSAVPGGPTLSQLRPPSVVRRMVPAEPATQATLSLTGASPRKRTVTPVSDNCQDGFRPPEAKPPVAASTASPSRAADIFRSDLMAGNLPEPPDIGMARSRRSPAAVRTSRGDQGLREPLADLGGLRGDVGVDRVHA